MSLWAYDQHSDEEDYHHDNDRRSSSSSFGIRQGSLTYDEVASAGSPARPLEFPTPTVHRCRRISLCVRDHRTGVVHDDLPNVIVRSGGGGETPDTAYLEKKKLVRTEYGSCRLCIVLKRCSPSKSSKLESREEGYDDLQSETSAAKKKNVEWESTNELAVVKISEWQKIHRLRGKHLEDPIKEVAAMQYLGNYSDHVLGVKEALQDDDYLYLVTTYLPGGDLYSRLAGENDNGVSEDQARKWFRQILSAIEHLQKKGVCSRDIGLENIHLDKKDRLVLLDFGVALRVPYADPTNYGGVADSSAGTSRRLMSTQGQCGKLMYIAPEVIEQKDSFDGFAIDLWSVGVVLFVMLVGMAPWKWAHPSDKRFSKISEDGGLKDLVDKMKLSISDEACDLLQRMLRRNVRKRLSLDDILEHPWVRNQHFERRSERHNPSPTTTTVQTQQTLPRRSSLSSPTKTYDKQPKSVFFGRIVPQRNSMST